MKIGTEVIYEASLYTIVSIYDNGYCEIKHETLPYRVFLVKLSDLVPVDEPMKLLQIG